jgi:hypothetical protein
MEIETRKVHDVLVVDMSGTLDSTSSGEAGDRIVDSIRPVKTAAIRRPSRGAWRVVPWPRCGGLQSDQERI